MTIKAVFRVQCDGPCKGWLSLPDDYRYTVGTTTRYEDLVTRPRPQRAGTWPGERAARRAATGNGWVQGHVGVKDGYGWLCPACALNPLGIRIPRAAPCLGTHATWAVCKECA